MGLVRKAKMERGPLEMRIMKGSSISLWHLGTQMMRPPARSRERDMARPIIEMPTHLRDMGMGSQAANNQLRKSMLGSRIKETTRIGGERSFILISK